MNENIEKALSKAKIKFLRQDGCVFFSTVCLSLETEITDRIPTAATNGKSILINPDFFLGLTLDEQVFLLAHETLHVVHMHMCRRGTRDPRLWNVAGDYVINADLNEAGFTVIQGALYASRFHGKTTEEVYNILEQEGNQEQPDHDDIMQGDSSPSEGNSEGNSIAKVMTAQEQEQMAKEITDILVRADTLTKLRGGVVPTSVERLLNEILRPILPWPQILKKFLTATTKSDYSWKRPHTKYGVMLPRLDSPRVGRVDFAIDVSGSIGTTEFNQFLSEVFAVLKAVKPQSIGVIQFDHEIRSNQAVKSAKDLQKVKFNGGGGTDALLAFEAFKQNKTSKALIILTDGYIDMDGFSKAEKRPVIWCVFDNPSFTCPNPRKDKVIHFTLGT